MRFLKEVLDFASKSYYFRIDDDSIYLVVGFASHSFINCYRDLKGRYNRKYWYKTYDRVNKQPKYYL